MHAGGLRDPDIPKTQSPRVLPKPLGLAAKSRLRAGGHVPLCWHLLPVLSINYSSSTVPATLSRPPPRRGGEDTALGCQDLSWPIWANTSMGVDKSPEGGGPEAVVGLLGRVTMRMDKQYWGPSPPCCKQ